MQFHSDFGLRKTGDCQQEDLLIPQGRPLGQAWGDVLQLGVQIFREPGKVLHGVVQARVVPVSDPGRGVILEGALFAESCLIVQLRLACAELMAKQGCPEPTGQAKITWAYNLPCRYVLHTVGPIVQGPLTKEHQRQLASCYRSCLDLAGENHCKSVAFCCISTGEFHFPRERATEIAVETVKAWQAQHPGELEVVFNVFKDSDREIYEKLLG